MQVGNIDAVDSVLVCKPRASLARNNEIIIL